MCDKNINQRFRGFLFIYSLLFISLYVHKEMYIAKQNLKTASSQLICPEFFELELLKAHAFVTGYSGKTKK